MNTKLINAVLRQLVGTRNEARQDAIGAGINGADGGWRGFIYYTDTAKFTARNRALIAEMVAEMSDEYGQGEIEFVKSFRCLDKDTSEKAIALALYGGNGKDDDRLTVENALAWFALEEVGRYLADQEDN